MNLIGLTGKRGAGKSEAAKFFEGHGYQRVHTFGPGKAAAIGYYAHVGIDEETAHRMVHGDLKDEPCALLPNNSTSRYFMEEMGKWMPSVLGVEWTLGAELDRLERLHPGSKALAESVVYEADALRKRGGMIIRITRPGHEGPAGIHTDGGQAGIVADHEIINDGSLDDLKRKVDEFLT